MTPERESLNIVVAGQGVPGKSTLIGRLIHDTGSLPVGKEEKVRAGCERRGVPFEWAYLMEVLQDEPSQAHTFDTARVSNPSANRDYVLIDAPGHRELLENMIAGTASADAAVLVIDATEGVQEQSHRYACLLHLLGVQQIAVAATKMDVAGFDRARFERIETEIAASLSGLGLTPGPIVPVSGRDGDNLIDVSPQMPWYSGPALVAALDHFQVVSAPDGQPLRFPLQDVYERDRRPIVAGRIESGILRVGETLLFSPSNTTARVAAIEASIAAPAVEARAGDSVGITLDERVPVARGEVASHVDRAPVETDVFRARLFWLGDAPLQAGRSLTLKLMARESPVEVQSIERIIDTGDLSATEKDTIERHGVAEVVLRTPEPIALDAAADLPRSGRFMLLDDHRIVGGGLVSMEGYADQRQIMTVRATNITQVEHRISAAVRTSRFGHGGGVLWLTGLSGAGKSTLAVEAERELFNRGYLVYVLDGDNVRHGLNANLGFSPEDRAENIRRVGEVAALFTKAGFIVISAFISPYRSDRDRARAAAGDGFHEIYVQADLATCEARDPKGLYRRARAGEIEDFTGISAPYEEPATPDLVVDTVAMDVAQAVAAIIDYAEKHFGAGR